MYRIFKTISDVLSGKASLFVILTAVVTFFFPVLFEWVKGNTQTVILGIIMLTMGLTLTPEDFKLLAKRPFDILIGAMAQFTIMPLVAFSLSWLFSQVPAFAPYSTAMAIGIILVGCCPGGVSSNIMSFLCKGDVAYSVGMTCASTLLAPVLTPLLVLWLAGERVDVDAWGMFQQILIVTIIPIAIGFFLNVWLGHKEVFKKIQGCMPGVSVACLACIVGGVVTTVHDPLVENGIVLFLLTFGMVQETYPLHRGGHAKCRVGHQPRHDLLRGNQSDGSGALCHLMRMAQHQRHHTGKHLCQQRQAWMMYDG